MKIKGIIWFDDIIEKLDRKHNVLQHEVNEVLSNNPRVRYVEKGHHQDEDVYAAMGQAESGRRLIVFFVYKTDGHALILSAREMTRSERRLYEKA